MKRCKFPNAAWVDPKCCEVCGACDGSLRPQNRPERKHPALPVPGVKEIQESAQDRRKHEKWNFVLR